MIVDDEACFRSVVRSILDKTYDIFDVPTAMDAKEFIEVLIPDLFLIDQVMPKIDGQQLAKDIRSVHKTTPIIMITGYDNPELEKSYKDYGINAYIKKPIREADLLREIDDLLKNSRSA